jgi:hypothetical protein
VAASLEVLAVACHMLARVDHQHAPAAVFCEFTGQHSAAETAPTIRQGFTSFFPIVKIDIVLSASDFD